MTSVRGSCKCRKHSKRIQHYRFLKGFESGFAMKNQAFSNASTSFDIMRICWVISTLARCFLLEARDVLSWYKVIVDTTGAAYSFNGSWTVVRRSLIPARPSRSPMQFLRNSRQLMRLFEGNKKRGWPMPRRFKLYRFWDQYYHAVWLYATGWHVSSKAAALALQY